MTPHVQTEVDTEGISKSARVSVEMVQSSRDAGKMLVGDSGMRTY